MSLALAAFPSSGRGATDMSRIIAAFFLALAGCASLPAAERLSIPTGSRYVAMGSSFAAGPLLGPPKAGTPPRCTRSAINYPTLLAQRLSLSLEDVTCSGATTAHILERWNELPAQIDTVTDDTRLVTLTVGGNDLGYVTGLMGSSCRAGAPGRPGPCFAMRNPGEDDYARVETALREIALQVAKRAPQAKLVFVQYVTLVPPARCSEAWFVPEEAAISRTIGVRLAALTTKVAHETGAILLPVDQLSREHTPCSSEPWSIGMYPGYDGSRGASWHPNAVGMRAIADALVEQIGA